MLKRYKVVSIFIIICFLSAFIALYNGVIATNQIIEQINAKNEYQYVYQEKFMVDFKDYKINCEKLLNLVTNIKEGNISIDGLSLFLDQTSSIHYPEILLKQNEALSIPCNDSINKLPENNIILADNYIKENMVTSNKYQLNVYVFLDTEKYPFTKGTIIIGAKDYFKIVNDVMDENILNFNISSNKENIYQTSLELKNIIKQNYPNATIYSIETTNNENIFQSNISGQSIIFIGLFMFALLNTMIISYYLVFVRKREIAIRKAFGFTNARIIKMLMKDIGELVVLSAIIGIVLQLIIDLVITHNFSFYNYITLLLPMLICIVISIAVAVIIPIRLVIKIDPAEGVKR